MPYNAKAVANYFLDLAERDRSPVDPIKLQKLVYLAHGWCLALRDRPLIDEQVEAARYGPFIPSLFDEFTAFGDGPIAGRAMTVDWSEDDAGRITYPGIGEGAEADWTRRLLKRIWEVYGRYTSTQLANMAHEEGTPWDLVRKEYEGELPRGTDIPRSMIRDYFVAMARDAKAPAS